MDTAIDRSNQLDQFFSVSFFFCPFSYFLKSLLYHLKKKTIYRFVVNAFVRFSVFFYSTYYINSIDYGDSCLLFKIFILFLRVVNSSAFVHRFKTCVEQFKYVQKEYKKNKIRSKLYACVRCVCGCMNERVGDKYKYKKRMSV